MVRGLSTRIDHYSVLGVSPTASLSEIKKAYFNVRYIFWLVIYVINSLLSSIILIPIRARTLLKNSLRFSKLTRFCRILGKGENMIDLVLRNLRKITAARILIIHTSHQIYSATYFHDLPVGPTTTMAFLARVSMDWILTSK